MQSKAKKVASTVGKVFLWLIIAVCAIFILLTLSRKQGGDGASKMFGYSFLPVQSDSMKGEGAENFQKGDMIVVKALSQDQIDTLAVGDIITFHDFIDGFKVLNTHRIAEVVYKTDVNGAKVLDADGEPTVTAFVTKGDNNPVRDPIEREPSDIIALYSGTKIASAGTVLDFLQSKWGFFFCLVLPLGLFFLWRIYKLLRAYTAYRKAGDEEEAQAAAPTDMDTLARLLADANVDPELLAATLKAQKAAGADAAS